MGYDAVMKHPNNNDPERIPRFMWIVLAAVIVITAAFSIPAALRSYRSSGLQNMIQQYMESKSNSGSSSAPLYQVRLYFISPETNGTLALTPFPIETDSQSGLNGLLEKLLAGPTLSQLQKGGISLIPEGTQLIGTSIADQAAFIELSKEFLVAGIFGREGTELACRQITETARSLPFISESIIMVDGSVFYYSNETSP